MIVPIDDEEVNNVKMAGTRACYLTPRSELTLQNQDATELFKIKVQQSVTLVVILLRLFQA